MTLSEGLMYGKKPNVKLPDNGSVWLAGGSVRRWFTGEKQDSDIDVFSSSLDLLETFAKDNGLKKIYDTKNASTYKKDGLVVQTIKLLSATPQECIDKMDFKHCQFAYDGKQVIATDEAVICALRKHLMFHKMVPGYEVDTLRRAFKYQRQGYTPCAGTIRALAKALQGLTDEQIAAGGGISTWFD